MSVSAAAPAMGSRPVEASAAAGAPAVEPAALSFDKPEKFLPVTVTALIDRLTRDTAWPAGNAADARRFFRYLNYWRRNSYANRLIEMDRAYEPFSPDSDLLVTRRYDAAERQTLQKRFVGQMAQLLGNANYEPIAKDRIDLLLTKDSHYGLDLYVDTGAFEELLIFYRGSKSEIKQRRDRKKFYLRKEEYELPIFQRLFVLFKLKPDDVRVREVMAEQRCDRHEAERIVRRMRRMLPPQVKSDFIYMKLFKNMPRSDAEMVFPNTRVRFRMLDKLKLGVTAGGGVGAGVFGAAGKIALIFSNPVAAAGAAIGLGGVLFRQVMNFVNQKNRYLVTMAQNLYFHALADNRGVMTVVADRAGEEDVKEEMLLYAVLAKEQVSERELPEVDRAIEQYVWNTFGIDFNFDVEDALGRLLKDGIVRREADGRLVALSPKDAALKIDANWDGFLDNLADDARIGEGEEFDGNGHSA